MSTDENLAGNNLEIGWGLLPNTQPSELTLQVVFHYWFVQYNPLYFISVLCVLSGIYLLNGELAADYHGESWLFGIVQLYELLLLGGAAILARKAGTLRPAVMLVLLECVFLFDPTFRLENLSCLGTEGLILIGLWLFISIIKLWLLSYALPLRISPLIYAVVFAGMSGLAGMLLGFTHAVADHNIVVLIASWLGGISLAVTLLMRPKIEWKTPLKSEHLTILKRSCRGALYLLAMLYFLHIFSRIIFIMSAPQLLVAQFDLVLLLVVLTRTEEVEVWVSTAAVLIFSLLSLPLVTVIHSFVAAGVLIWHSRRMHQYRFITGALLVCYFACWQGVQKQFFPLDFDLLWVAVAVGIGLLFVAWRLRESSAWVVLIAAAVWYGQRLWYLLPTTRLGIGILLLISGFMALFGGIAINWWLREPPKSAANELAPKADRETS